MAELARKLDGPIFEPHLTLGAGADSETTARAQLAKISATHRAIELRTLGIDFSARFTQTLFLRMGGSEELEGLRDALANAGDGADFEPHISLLYAKIPSEIQAAECGRMEIPLATIRFDALRAISFRDPVETRGDVEDWRTIAEANLGSA